MVEILTDAELAELRKCISPQVFVTASQRTSKKYDVSDYNVWTLSADPFNEGWETDSACEGYGLPKLVAEKYANAINALPKLLDMIDKLKK